VRIYIPSKGRAEIQRTFSRLPNSLKAKTKIVVPPADYPAYTRAHGALFVIPCPEVGIAPTRDWILNYDTAEDDPKVVMLDDDLIFQKLRENGQITNCTEEEVEEAFDWLDKALDAYAHAGFAVRFSDRGNAGQETRSPARMMHVLGYNLRELPEHAGFCRGVANPATFSMDDFNMTLQLLTEGVPNIVSSVWRTSPAPGNAKGGASTWRTLETQNASAHQLVKLFPQFVSLRQKKNWQGIDGGQMFDVTVYWQRAYAHGSNR
jgi:hypothetical protein